MRCTRCGSGPSRSGTRRNGLLDQRRAQLGKQTECLLVPAHLRVDLRDLVDETVLLRQRHDEHRQRAEPLLRQRRHGLTTGLRVKPIAGLRTAEEVRGVLGQHRSILAQADTQAGRAEQPAVLLVPYDGLTPETALAHRDDVAPGEPEPLQADRVLFREALQALAQYPPVHRQRALRAELALMPPLRHVPGPVTLQRIRAALRSALTSAMKEELVTVNVAKLVELPAHRRARPMLWTEPRVRQWRRTGEIPSPVMVWTSAHTRTFLTHSEPHEFHAYYVLVAHLGLRRGEAAGLRWPDIDFRTGAIGIDRQIVQVNWTPQVTPTKTAAGERTVIAPKPVLTALARHRRRQRERARKAGAEWNEEGWVFTDHYGDHLTPDQFLTHFQALTKAAGLPPVRLHDLRHGAATLARAAGVDLKTVSAMLGHSSVTITADIYTSVVDEAKREAADRIADLLAAELDDEGQDGPEETDTTGSNP